MNSEELKSAIQVFYDNYEEIGITVYVIFKNQDDIHPKKVDIEAESLRGLKELFFQSLHETITDKTDLSVLNLSTSDERTDAIYVYDLEVPSELSAMETIVSTDNLPLFNLQHDSLSNIKALLIEIGNDVGQLVLYKTMASINIFGRSSFFLRKSNHRFEKIDDEFLRISSGFQLLRINGELLVIDLNTIEKSFSFYDVIVREATAGIAKIEEIQLIENPNVLHDLLEDVKYARRFTKIAKSSPVLKAGVDNASIISFCKKFPQLAGKIRFNDAEDKIIRKQPAEPPVKNMLFAASCYFLNRKNYVHHSKMASTY